MPDTSTGQQAVPPSIDGWDGPHGLSVPHWTSEANHSFDLNAPCGADGWEIEFDNWIDGSSPYLPITSAELRAMADAMDAFDAAAVIAEGDDS